MTAAGRVTELDERTCRQLLARADVGRVALNDDPSPTVLPVNYAYRDGTIVFPSSDGRKWRAARTREAASFEVDGIDTDRRSGWSVLARGTLAPADPGDATVAAMAGDLDSIADLDGSHLIRFDVDVLTGRRIPHDPAWSESDLPGNVWYGRDGTDLLG